MTDNAPPVHFNSPIIQRAAEKAGLPITEFIEYCVLQMIRIQEVEPAEFLMLDGSTPWERLQNVRFSINFFERYKKLCPENQATMREQFPETIFPATEEQS
ncbi:hypothetical protein P4E94_14820 [Pontiellaceae bacterium B12219]|nr:hypothetical protein [Pontiellaceae bacterium B12219]